MKAEKGWGDLYSKGNSPIQVGSVKLKNRFVFAPLVTNLAHPDGTVSDRLIDFVKARAAGGVGLVITENTAVNQAGRLFPNTRIDDDRFIPGLSRLFQAIHDAGAKALFQLDHEGRETTTEATGGLGPVAPSAIPSPTFNNEPREMIREEIQSTIDDFLAAALRAQSAGADGVEIQSGHGFLVHQFLSSRTNKRTDEFGGVLENRARFLIEIIQRIKAEAGKEFPVCCRISGDDFISGGLNLTEAIAIARLIEKAGADLIHVSAGVLETVDHIVPPEEFPDLPHAKLSFEIKQAVGIPVIAVGKIPGLDAAEHLLKEGKADMVAFARSMLADSQLVAKELAERHQEVVRCDHCNTCFAKILSKNPEIACKLHKKKGND